jgi:hypothetical protein
MMKICKHRRYIYNQNPGGFKSCSKSLDWKAIAIHTYNKDNQNLKGEITSLTKKRVRYISVDLILLRTLLIYIYESCME